MKKTIFYLTTIFFILQISACNTDSSNGGNRTALKLIAAYDIDVPEPSALAFDSVNRVLFTVSDETHSVYKISTEGRLLQTYTLNGDDFEAVCIYKDNFLLIADEKNRDIIKYDKLNNSQENFTIKYSANDENHGIEGIAFNPEKNEIYAINEKNPGELLVLDTLFNIKNNTILFLADDYSSLCYVNETGNLWILSDESNKVFRCETNGKKIAAYNTNVEQAEGLAIDYINKKIYIVSDPLEKLYVFELPE